MTRYSRCPRCRSLVEEGKNCERCEAAWMVRGFGLLVIAVVIVVLLLAGCQTGPGGGTAGAGEKRLTMSEARATVLANQAGRSARATAEAAGPMREDPVPAVERTGGVDEMMLEAPLPPCERAAVEEFVGSIVTWPGDTRESRSPCP